MLLKSKHFQKMFVINTIYYLTFMKPILPMVQKVSFHPLLQMKSKLLTKQ